jgi:histone deacetylase 1/2
MKPHRIRVTHDLVTAYGMLDKMHILVRIYPRTSRVTLTFEQKPTRASPEVMTSFHTDEYVHFLQNVTPELAEKLTFHGTRCMSLYR